MPVVTELPGVAVVTGAASGIGQSVAKAFASAGCSGIALLDVNTDGLANTKAMLLSVVAASSSQSVIRVYHCDVSSEESVNKAYAQARADFLRIDYSIHCAGINILAAASADLPVDLFDRQLQVNARGVFLCSKAAIGIMKSQTLDSEAYPAAEIAEYRGQRGAVVNVASSLGYVNMPMSPAYCAAKAAVISLTRSDAQDYAKDRIRINSVAPGLVDTPMTNPNPETRAFLQATFIDGRMPVKRFAQPEEISDVILFLVSNKASFVTGAGWLIDGGHLTC